MVKKLSLKILFVLLILFTVTLFSQNNWSERKLLSQSDSNDNPQIEIDDNGDLHAIWCEAQNVRYSYIVYSKSEDEGETWTEPYKITDNDTMKVYSTQLVVDSENNPHVSFSLARGEGSRVMYTKFDGAGWSDDYEIHTNMISKLRMTIDNNDRIYTFWISGDATSYFSQYSYSENEMWSEVDIINYEMTYVLLNTFINENNLVYTIGIRSGTKNEAYFCYYDEQTESWSECERIYTFEYDSFGDAIAVSNNGIIHTSISLDSDGNEACYTFKEGIWSTPDYLFDRDIFFKSQIFVESEIPYIFDIYSEGSNNDREYKLICSYKEKEEWVTEVVEFDSLYWINWFDTTYNQENNRSYVIYHKGISGVFDNHKIFLKSKQIEVGIEDNYELEITNYELTNYPNPFNNSTTINFKLPKTNRIKLDIYNSKGEKVKNIINNKKLLSGEQKYKFTASNLNSGVYYSVLIIGKNRKIVKKILFLK